MIRKALKVLDVKVKDEAEGIISAVVNVTGVEDLQRDVMEVGSWDEVIKSMRAGEADWPSVLWSHEWSLPVGKVLEAEEVRPGDLRLKGLKVAKNAGALFITARYNLETQRGKEAFSDVKFGSMRQYSVGFMPADGAVKYDDKGVRHIAKVGAWPEVSNVLVGASPGTYTAVAKGADTAEDRAERSQDRLTKALALAATTKDIPELTGPEAVHNEALQSALTSVWALLQQEAAEDEREPDCVMRLVSIYQALLAFAQDEANEYTDYAQYSAPISEYVQAGIVTLNTKESAVAEAEPIEDSDEEDEESTAGPEPEPEPIAPDDLVALYILETLRDATPSPQHSDPEPSGEEHLVSWARQNTRR